MQIDHQALAPHTPGRVAGQQLIVKATASCLFFLCLVEEENENFDPYIHEAILKTESDSEDGSILNVLRNGYVMNDEVIRPTQVEIAENFKKKNNDKEK